MTDFSKILATVAPWLGAAATGGVPALVGMAAATIGKAIGSDVKPTSDAIAQAISGATPEQMLAIKQADNEFALKMQELGFNNVQHLEQIAADDRASAREMHKAMKDWQTPILTYMVCAAFFYVVFLILTRAIDVPDNMRDVVMMLLGQLAAAFSQVLNFRFGTSAGSKEKTQLLTKKP